jgi:hypothetical protein
MKRERLLNLAVWSVILYGHGVGMKADLITRTTVSETTNLPRGLRW